MLANLATFVWERCQFNSSLTLVNSVTLPALTLSWQLCRKSKPFTVQFDMQNLEHFQVNVKNFIDYEEQIRNSPLILDIPRRGAINNYGFYEHL